MSEEAAAADDVRSNPMTQEDVQRELQKGINSVAFQRLIEDEEALRAQIEARYEEAQEKSRGKAPDNNTLIEEISTGVVAKFTDNNPDLIRQAQAEAQETPIDDIFGLLTPTADDPKWDGYSDAEKDAVLDLRDDPKMQDILRQQRYIEDTLGRPEGMPPLKDRVQEWVKSGHAKEAATKAKYAVMAGMIIASPPLAASMVASMAIRRVVLPKSMEAGQKLAKKTSDFLVDSGVVSREQVDKNVARLDNATQTVTGSKLGRFGMALGALAATGVVASVAMDAVNGDDLGTRMQNLWGSAKDLVSDTPAIEPEVSEEAIQSAEQVASGEPLGTDALTHSDGGNSRDALADRFDEAGHSDMAERIRAMESAQLSPDDVSTMASEMNTNTGSLTPEQMVATAQSEFGVDLSGLSQAVDTPIHTLDVTPAELNMSAEATGSAPADAVSPDAGAPDVAAHVSHDVVVGDTLSEAVYDAYQDQGVQLSASELYGPSEHTAHPGGIVGMVADQNGYADPNLIYPGDTISMDIPSPDASITPEVSDQARAAAEQVAAPEPSISNEALDAANSVAQSANEPMVSDVAKNAAVEAATGAEQAESTTKESPPWLLGIAGAMKRMFGQKEPDVEGEFDEMQDVPPLGIGNDSEENKPSRTVADVIDLPSPFVSMDASQAAEAPAEQDGNAPEAAQEKEPEMEGEYFGRGEHPEGDAPTTPEPSRDGLGM